MPNGQPYLNVVKVPCIQQSQAKSSSTRHILVNGTAICQGTQVRTPDIDMSIMVFIMLFVSSAYLSRLSWKTKTVSHSALYAQCLTQS